METMVGIRAYYGYIYPPSMDCEKCKVTFVHSGEVFVLSQIRDGQLIVPYAKDGKYKIIVEVIE